MKGISCQVLVCRIFPACPDRPLFLKGGPRVKEPESDAHRHEGGEEVEHEIMGVSDRVGIEGEQALKETGAAEAGEEQFESISRDRIRAGRQK
jgi:hypothetical protein